MEITPMRGFKFFIAFLLLFTVTQCKKKNVASDTPGAIEQAIVKFDKDNGCGSAKVDEYMFQTQKVYTFDPGTCGADMTSRVADQNNNTLGELGGISGNTKINGEDFSNAVFIRTVWHK